MITFGGDHNSPRPKSFLRQATQFMKAVARDHAGGGPRAAPAHAESGVGAAARTVSASAVSAAQAMQRAEARLEPKDPQSPGSGRRSAKARRTLGLGPKAPVAQGKEAERPSDEVRRRGLAKKHVASNVLNTKALIDKMKRFDVDADATPKVAEEGSMSA